jgi:hypothetical protein
LAKLHWVNALFINKLHVLGVVSAIFAEKNRIRAHAHAHEELGRGGDPNKNLGARARRTGLKFIILSPHTSWRRGCTLRALDYRSVNLFQKLKEIFE